MDQGSDFLINLPAVKNADGTVVNLTHCQGVSARMSPSYFSSPDRQIPLTTTIVNPPTTGVISLALPSAITGDIRPSRYVYDCIMTDQSGFKTKIFEGLLTVMAAVASQRPAKSTPVITSVILEGMSASNVFFTGDFITLTVGISKPVFVAGAPTIGLTIGGANPRQAAYVSGTGTCKLTFQYQVTSQDVATPGQLIIAPVIGMGVGVTINDVAGDALSLVYAGSGAAATATLGEGGEIYSIALISGGSGYLIAPVVNIISPGIGAGARATCTVSAGAVNTMTLKNAGSSYAAPPSIVFTPQWPVPSTLGITINPF